MPSDPIRVLFLCTGNSARSILAEALLTQRGDGAFVGYSAGSQPKGAPHPAALALLDGRGVDTARLRSKSWDEFAAPAAPDMDVIITVCDNAAGEVCPIWPGHPAQAHWGLPDPAAVTAPPEAVTAAFAETAVRLEQRIDQLIAADIAALDPDARKARLAAIHAGLSTPEDAAP